MDNLLKRSADFETMAPYWQLVDAITDGVEALRNCAYLPQFPNESKENYKYRRDSSRFTDIFNDIIESLASKPFANEAGLADDDVPQSIRQFIENVDGAGNHLHVFAHDVFVNGISHGLDWIFVDHTRLPEGATLADERQVGARPYFVRIPAERLLEVKTSETNGEQFVYVRINESTKDDEGNVIERVRTIQKPGSGNPVYQLHQATDGGWQVVDEGVLSLPVIPLVPFYTGRRKPGSWQFTLPMKRVAHLQIEHYQQETNLKLAKENTAFPMLTGEGIAPPVDENGKQIKLPVGPSTVLYAPMNEQGQHGQWNIIEPSTTSLEFLSKEIDKTETQMRELGRQPLTAGTAGLTQVAAAFASQRSSSAAQAWTYGLKDALEKALAYAAQWMGVDVQPAVYVDTDFAIEIGDDKAPELLIEMAREQPMGEAPFITRQTFLREIKRRGILSPEFSEQDEVRQMLDNIE